jgi:hypothetical protein
MKDAESSNVLKIVAEPELNQLSIHLRIVVAVKDTPAQVDQPKDGAEKSEIFSFVIEDSSKYEKYYRKI